MTFLEKPHLPDGKVKLCAIAARHNEIKKALEAMDITVLEVLPNAGLSAPVNRHADMQLHDMGRGEMIAAAGAGALIKTLESYGFKVKTHELSAKYPDNIALNCFILKESLFCLKKSTSKALLRYYQSLGISVLDVKQGYAKCSTCIVDGSSIITADTSIAVAAQANGITALVIKSGSIRLDGYDYGFIGGCSGLVDKNKLAFCGKVSGHPDYPAINDFCITRGVELIELGDFPLTDIGGIIPLAL